ncbi:galactose mutarotase-like domain-containing protein [Halteromyces radiatus]|uniref:galactose mutarotase-like domain-containing protein n=1 Tax=Halteromyces radiatus TaxID=101107 RepID=UPI0022202475|nr:galactose mutarotase-like domain-containing protein [Halteromyces radiatus]KAI8092804.1 galactose mutarotase-like domain-containing protein [Halteromyces radiatus]
MATLKPSVDITPKIPKNIEQSRINNFLAPNGQFYSMGIRQGLWTERHSGDPYVKLSVYDVPDLKRITFKEAIGQKFEPIQQHQRSFGPSWSTHWFKVDIIIPEVMVDHPVVFQWDMDSEGLVWSTDGIPLQGLTGGDDQARQEYILTQNATKDQEFSFYIEAACNGMFGVGDNDAMVPDPNRYFNIKKADLVIPAYSIQKLYYDLVIIQGIAYDTNQDSSRARQAVWVLNEIINQFIINDPTSIDKCLNLSSEFLAASNGEGEHQITAIGHCHIDTAWLWPFDETKRKVARSWSSQLDLINRYPDYVFTASQVQQYEWLEELYPDLFRAIQEQEKLGRWEIIGGSWVEHDTNMPSGESLCRQMLLGQTYFEKKFGKRTNVFWLPDSFGYSGQLPQVLKQSGCDYFFTQKLSWNNINKFPLTTFWWTGIDNSRVLAHLTPADTYNAMVTPSELYKCTTNHHDIEYSNRSLLVYGNGDGGGGPAPEHLERLKRMKNVDGLPSCKPGQVIDFFKNVEDNSQKLQAYKGELYLEFHRGTYTTQALVKRGNRQCEVLIRDVEFLSTAARLFHSNNISKQSSYSYPTKDINRLWKLICLNQFHDCLPGSGIGLAYVDVHKYHREVIYESLTLRRKAQDYILFGEEGHEKKQSGNCIAIFNTLPWTRSDIVSMPEKNTHWSDQQWKDEHEYIIVESVPGFSVAVFPSQSIPRVEPNEGVRAYQQDSGEFVLENSHIKGIFNSRGQLLELYDKHSNRGNLVPSGSKGNILQLYEDVPTYWDAWDVEIYHLQKYKILENNESLKISANGPLRAELTFRQDISKDSWIEQNISLTCLGTFIEFDSAVEWHEKHQFLKTEFNWDIITDFATYDIQYGVLRRPNHYNSTLDSARFEVCGHKFADLSDANYGVALLNNCKYGYATHEKSQRLSLLRSPKGPDENADMGRHKFKYAIFPHNGNFESSDVVRKALEFNVPLSYRQTNYYAGPKTFSPSLFSIDPPGRIIIDTVKLAENDQDQGKTVILRIYEAYGGQSRGTLTSSLNINTIQISNILEDDTNNLLTADKDGGFTLNLTPFQILTLKIQLN